PKRYKYTQRWHENAQKPEEGASSEFLGKSGVEEENDLSSFNMFLDALCKSRRVEMAYNLFKGVEVFREMVESGLEPTLDVLIALTLTMKWREFIGQACLPEAGHQFGEFSNGYKMELGLQENIFAFGGSWSIQYFYNHEPFGETKVYIALFPSLKSIGYNEVAMINQGFFLKFLSILQTTSFKDEVEKIIKEGKPIIFTGHSSGGSVAMLAAVW
nr:enhanced disease susceptibility 1 protein [Tanacetum cinerariifolium]